MMLGGGAGRVFVRLALTSIAVAAASCIPASAEDRPPAVIEPPAPAAPLPRFALCHAAHPPVLPPRWHAVGLMMPFDGGQLAIGEFDFDAEASAMRATIYGLQSGTADLLITAEATYRLSGPRQSPTGCTAAEPRFQPPTTQWLAANAQCVGEAPLQARQTEWWRIAAANSAANWFWFTADARLPWRVFMSSPSPNPPLIGDYAMTYFPTFERVSQSNLAALREFCRAQSRPAASAKPADTEHDGTRQPSEAEEAAEAERRERIKVLIPGLSQDACAATIPARWPDRVQMTALMTPTQFGLGPFPTEIFYDWERSNAMLTRLHDPDNPAMAVDVLLKGPLGYDIKPGRLAAPTCQQNYPGIVKPDWLSGASCACRGVIANNPQLDPDDTIDIESCGADPTHALWAWYRKSGAPVAFLATLQTPGGLDLADYYSWSPGAESGTATFAVPLACMAPNRVDRLPPPDRARLTRLFATRCAACHVFQQP